MFRHKMPASVYYVTGFIRYNMDWVEISLFYVRNERLTSLEMVLHLVFKYILANLAQI
jgi:hypothetical protein